MTPATHFLSIQATDILENIWSIKSEKTIYDFVDAVSTIAKVNKIVIVDGSTGGYEEITDENEIQPVLSEFVNNKYTLKETALSTG